MEHMTPVDRERTDLLETLAKHRGFLRYTVRDLTDTQASMTTTVSELCLGGLIKHVAAVEARWADFIVRGADAFAAVDAASIEAHAATFRMNDGETLDSILEH